MPDILLNNDRGFGPCFATTVRREPLPGGEYCDRYRSVDGYKLGVYMEGSCLQTPEDWARLKEYGFSYTTAYPGQLPVLYAARCNGQPCWTPKDILLAISDLANVAVALFDPTNSDRSTQDRLRSEYDRAAIDISNAIRLARANYGEDFYGLGLNEVSRNEYPGAKGMVMDTILSEWSGYYNRDRIFENTGRNFRNTADDHINPLVERYDILGPSYWRTALEEIIAHNNDELAIQPPWINPTPHLIQPGFWISGDKTPGTGGYYELDHADELFTLAYNSFETMRRNFGNAALIRRFGTDYNGVGSRFDEGVIWYYDGNACFEMLRRIQRHVTVRIGDSAFQTLYDNWLEAIRRNSAGHGWGEGWVTDTFTDNTVNPPVNYNSRAILRRLAETGSLTINYPIHDTEPEIARMLNRPNGDANLADFLTNFCAPTTSAGLPNPWNRFMCSMNCRRLHEFLCKAEKNGWLTRKCYRGMERETRTIWACNLRDSAGRCLCPYPPSNDDDRNSAGGWYIDERTVNIHPKEFVPPCDNLAMSDLTVPPCPPSGPPHPEIGNSIPVAFEIKSAIELFDRGPFDIEKIFHDE